MCVTQLNQVILDAAVKTFSQKNSRTSNSKAKQKRKPKKKIWFTQECDKLRRALRKLTKAISKFPFDRGRIASFRRVKAEYKKTCKRAESKSRHILREKLLNFRNDDPKGFWN